MIPKEVKWCLSPDLDEYFSINTHSEMEKIIESVPHVTNISCDRLDIYSHHVRVGPPNNISSNKIHLRADYTWVQPVYEYLSWIHKDRDECELYSDDIFLIHDQDFLKKERPELYTKLMEDEYRNNPSNCWNLWFLSVYYKKTNQLEKFIPTACDFIKYENNQSGDWFKKIHTELANIYYYSNTSLENKNKIINTLKSKPVK